MSLPPERLSIKRRRDEDPVDCLYLQQKRIKSDFIYTIVKQDQALDHVTSVARSRTVPRRLSLVRHYPSNPQAPTVKATLPGAEYATKIHERPTRIENTIPDDQSSPVTTANLNGLPQGAVAPTRTRRFHLATSAFLSPSHVEAGQGISKRKIKAPSRFPVFTEKKYKELSLQGQNSDPTRQHREPTLGNAPTTSLAQQVKPPEILLKRPNATEEEIARGAEVWRKAGGPNQADPKLAAVSGSNSKQAHRDDAEHLAATEEMLDIVMKMSEAAKDVAGPTVVQSTLTTESTPPAPRSQRTPPPSNAAQQAELMDVGRTLANDDAYVYDTYVRAGGSSENMALDVFEGPGRTAPPSMQAEKVGILVIDEKDEQNWQEFLEDAVSDKEWDTDDEDENAEDYYGNDYPEDELDSDDQFERNAYSYRIDASEDEEFNYDSDTHSDPESERDFHWKGNTGVKSLRILDDSD